MRPQSAPSRREGTGSVPLELHDGVIARGDDPARFTREIDDHPRPCALFPEADTAHQGVVTGRRGVALAGGRPLDVEDDPRRTRQRKDARDVGIGAERRANVEAIG